MPRSSASTASSPSCVRGLGRELAVGGFEALGFELEVLPSPVEHTAREAAQRVLLDRGPGAVLLASRCRGSPRDRRGMPARAARRASAGSAQQRSSSGARRTRPSAARSSTARAASRARPPPRPRSRSRRLPQLQRRVSRPPLRRTRATRRGAGATAWGAIRRRGVRPPGAAAIAGDSRWCDADRAARDAGRSHWTARPTATARCQRRRRLDRLALRRRRRCGARAPARPLRTASGARRSRMLSMIGSRSRPFCVSEYSTRGGTSG